jgi:hypothetical protein
LRFPSIALATTNFSIILGNKPDVCMSFLVVQNHLVRDNVVKIFSLWIFQNLHNSRAILLDPAMQPVLPPFHCQLLGLLTNQLFWIGFRCEE